MWPWGASGGHYTGSCLIDTTRREPRSTSAQEAQEKSSQGTHEHDPDDLDDAPGSAGRARLIERGAREGLVPAFLHVRDGLIGDAPIDAPLLIGVREEQAVVADDVDDP